MSQFVLALDQGTTSSRAIVFDHQAAVVAASQQEFPQLFPSPGEVEHDPEEIWSSQLGVAREVLARAKLTTDQIVAIGVVNQRETVVLWDRETGKPAHNAIVWQSRVGSEVCERLKAEGMEETIRAKTGLLLDPYFSGSKLRHLLDKLPEVRRRAEQGKILFGTVDSFLIWRLTEGRCHVTDVSNASRTLLFNIHALDWDDELLDVFRVPRSMLPDVLPSSHLYGQTAPSLFGAPIPIAGAAGDQQAATFGQACFQPGMAKNTYGTGSFLLLNTGERPVMSRNKLLTTVGWQVGGQVTYCLEGSVFIAGAVVQWLRDGLGLIKESADIESLAATVSDNGGLVLVPAFVGLGAPHWDPYARGALLGITLGTNAGHLARAALESMAMQTHDMLEAMKRDAEVPLTVLKVDGGAAVNDHLMQFQSDILDVAVRRPVVSETTALGAAYLAGLAVGYWNGTSDIAENWRLDREFTPRMDRARRESLVQRWRRAVERASRWEMPDA
ncbi:MAG: glycerol kinase GlpK [Planctomycetota bacterium]